MFTFEKVETADFNPKLRRSDGVLISLETLMDWKALRGNEELERMIQDPSFTGKPLTKSFATGRLQFFDEHGQEVTANRSLTLDVPSDILKKILER